MVKKLKEGYSINNIRAFGVVDDDVMLYNGHYPEGNYKHIKLPKDCAFGNITKLIDIVQDYVDVYIPWVIEEFEEVHFNRIESKLTLGWTDGEDEWHELSFNMYNYPTLVRPDQLGQYGIEIK